MDNIVVFLMSFLGFLHGIIAFPMVFFLTPIIARILLNPWGNKSTIVNNMFFSLSFLFLFGIFILIAAVTIDFISAGDLLARRLIGAKFLQFMFFGMLSYGFVPLFQRKSNKKKK